MSQLVKGVDLKLPNGREQLIKAKKSDTDLTELYNKRPMGLGDLLDVLSDETNIALWVVAM